MRRSYLLAAFGLLVVAAGVAVPQRDFSNVQVEAAHVASNVYMLTGSGGNVGVSVGDDGALIVDDQFAPLAEKIRAAIGTIAKEGQGDLKFVLNTHWHGDHTGGNAIFGREATIIAQDNVRKRLMVAQGNQAVPKEALPVITFAESLSVHFNGEDIEVMHFPRGHTDGDSMIYFKGSNVVHMGDDFFAGRFPYVDLNSGGSVEGLVKNIAAAIEHLPAGVKVIPGHGPLCELSDLRAYHAMLVETTGLVRTKMSEGKTLEQIQAEGFPEKWATWGSGFITTERWIETIHSSFLNSQG